MGQALCHAWGIQWMVFPLKNSHSLLQGAFGTEGHIRRTTGGFWQTCLDRCGRGPGNLQGPKCVLRWSVVRSPSTLGWRVFGRILTSPVSFQLKHRVPLTFFCAPHSKAHSIPPPPIPVLNLCYLNFPTNSSRSFYPFQLLLFFPVSGLSPKPWGAVNGFRVATQTQIPMETKGLRKQKERKRQSLPDLLCSLSKFFSLPGMKASAYLYNQWNERTWPLLLILKFLKNLSSLWL